MIGALKFPEAAIAVASGRSLQTRHFKHTHESTLKLESHMKVKKVAVTAAVCAALLGSQGVMAEEQPIGAEGMDFAFDDAQVSSVQMSELSGVEMEETEGAWLSNAAGAGIGSVSSMSSYVITSPSPTWGGLINSGVGGAVSGAMSPASSYPLGVSIGVGNGIADGYGSGL
jgi:hypothetical protein